MTDATILSLAALTAPVLASLAALMRSYGNSMEIRANTEKLKELHKATESATARVNNLEIGNLADAAAKGIKDGQ